jgi:hypothetical protein
MAGGWGGALAGAELGALLNRSGNDSFGSIIEFALPLFLLLTYRVAARV